MVETADAFAPLLTIRDLRVDFDDGRRFAPAVRGLDLDVRRGDALGIVGESGCGKSVAWFAVLGLLGRRARVAGSARLGGTELIGAPPSTLEPVRGRRIAMIFQDPASALNPLLNVGAQLAEALWLHRGLSGAAAQAEAARLLDRVGVAGGRRRLRDYPHELSGGMNQRVMIAMALAGEPEILVADEPTTALDATIQAQILTLIARIRAEEGMALVLISHDLGVVGALADRVAVMYCGRIVETGPTDRLFDAPAHPYTRGLLDALPSLEGPRMRLRAIPGAVPPPHALPPGCALAPRCPLSGPDCAEATPPPVDLGGGHVAACLRARPAAAARLSA